jgi:anti-sigma regulatory factor (Ser/Thr protein kinase)
VDPVLIERWLGDGPRTRVHDQASVSVVREAARALGLAQGLDDVALGELAVVVTELATNQLRHALDGSMAVRAVERGGVAGVEVVAADGGGGIRDAAAALDGVARTEGSLGVGLAGVQRMADEVDFDVRLGVGTCVAARKFARPAGRRREVAVLGRNFVGQRTSGDDALVLRRGATLLLALVDGLGHGPDAREPARLAIEVVRGRPDASPAAMVLAADEALRGSRGAVMSVVRLDEAAGALAHAGLGNVTTSVRGAAGSRSYAGANGVLGMRSPRRQRIAEDDGALAPRDLVVMFTDGLRTRLDLDAAQAVLARHPLVLAQALLERFGRDNDDATLIVAR